MVDTTVHLGDIIFGLTSLIILPLVKSLSANLISLRDGVRDLTNILGSISPPTGVLGDVERLKEEIREHRDWLIQIKDRRHSSDECANFKEIR